MIVCQMGVDTTQIMSQLRQERQALLSILLCFLVSTAFNIALQKLRGVHT